MLYEKKKKKNNKQEIFYLFVCWNINNDEYGGTGLTFSTIFNSDKRRGLYRIIIFIMDFIYEIQT